MRKKPVHHSTKITFRQKIPVPLVGIFHRKTMNYIFGTHVEIVITKQEQRALPFPLIPPYPGGYPLAVSVVPASHN
jgi:hypothetical protein